MAKQLTGLEWLRAQMDYAGYDTLEQVAQKIGIHRGNLYRYFALQNVPSLALLPKLCSVLYTNADELLHALQLMGPKQHLEEWR